MTVWIGGQERCCERWDKEPYYHNEDCPKLREWRLVNAPSECFPTTEPIFHLEWVKASQLRANAWNPNFVMTAELRLLERSILHLGWVQPILISRDDLIVDGFHRVMLCLESQPIRERYEGHALCARLDIGEPEAIITTIRMNRAKGTHAAFRMSACIHRLIDEHGLDPQQVAKEIGASRAEIDLLYQDSVFKARKIADYRYSRAWVPVEDGKKLAP